jgi:uncharacterized protein (DUF433 family)
MNKAFATPPTITVPLHTDENGKIRVGNSRVLLELVIHAYYLGETPESIVDSYPTLKIADVYAVFSYYLDHPETIDAYVREQDKRADAILRDMEAKMSPQARALRARLRAHQAASKT